MQAGRVCSAQFLFSALRHLIPKVPADFLLWIQVRKGSWQNQRTDEELRVHNSSYVKW
jgi:hypothetical protein